MPVSQEILGQEADPLVGAPVDLFTATTGVVIASLSVCNRTGSLRLFRVALRKGGVDLENKHFFYFDHELKANKTFLITAGLGMAATDVITVSGNVAGLTFIATGPEFT